MPLSGQLSSSIATAPALTLSCLSVNRNFHANIIWISKPTAWVQNELLVSEPEGFWGFFSWFASLGWLPGLRSAPSTRVWDQRLRNPINAGLLGLNPHPGVKPLPQRF